MGVAVLVTETKDMPGSGGGGLTLANLCWVCPFCGHIISLMS